jgi:hypothetical protein
MKQFKILLLSTLIFGFSQHIKAQKYYVYDCTEFSVMFVCINDSTKIDEVDFSSKDENGQWKWNKFEIYDFVDMDNDDDYGDDDDYDYGDGFIYFVRDGSNNKYSVDYYRDEDYMIVRPVKEDSTISNTSWTLNRRVNQK